MALLSICTNAADMIGIARPAQVVGSSDKTARQMLALLNRGGKALARQKNAWGGGWQVLERLHSFDTVASTAEYDLPADFGSILGNTVWNRDEFFEVRGPSSPAMWQQLQSGLATSSQLRQVYRIKRIADFSTTARKFSIDPTPASAETVVFEYLSTSWVADTAGADFKQAFAVDTDMPLLPETLHEMDLIWRMKHAKGLEYGADLAEFEQERDRLIAAEVGATVSMGRRRAKLFPINVPDTGYGGV